MTRPFPKNIILNPGLQFSGICFAECGKTPFIQCGADAGGQLIIKPEIMQDSQSHPQHLTRGKKMTDVRTRKRTAGWTLTIWIDGPLVEFVFLIFDVERAFPCKELRMSGISGRHNAVEEVYATVYRFQNIRRCSYSHQIGWFVLRKMWNGPRA